MQHNLKRISTPASPFCYVCVFDLCPVFGKVGHLWKCSRQNKTFYGVSCSIFLCFMGVLFLLFLCLVVLFPWVYVFYTYFFFNVYTWSSPIKILIDFEIFLWNSYSLIFVFHQGHVIYVSVFRESFLYFFRKKNITTFFIFIIPFCQMYIYNRKILSDFNTTEYIHYL